MNDESKSRKKVDIISLTNTKLPSFKWSMCQADRMIFLNPMTFITEFGLGLSDLSGPVSFYLAHIRYCIYFI